ncbi:hypothetical protein M0805_005998 [Coniferiporia weirii]|nr:hypothetical protein M0805_005998 [Coniferiporia weirii]
MSQPQGDIGAVQLFLHVKGLEIDFKGDPPRYPVSLKIKADGMLLDSCQFDHAEVHWKWDNYLHIPTSRTDVAVSVRNAPRFGRKKNVAVFNFKPSNVTGKEILYIDGGKATMKLTCVPSLPIEDFVGFLAKEAQAQVGNKKVLLDLLGKAGKIMAIFIECTDLASDVHIAARAGVTVIKILYEKCNLQRECREEAVKLMDDLVSFLPFATDISSDLMKNDNTRQTARRMLELFCEISMYIRTYSTENILGGLLFDHKDDIDSLKEDFAKLREAYSWCIKTEVWRSVIATEGHTEDQLLRNLHPAATYYNADDVCMRGTRTAILEEISQWASGESSLFWLHGLAGSGKSFIANSVAQMFEEQQRHLGCFFCKRDDPDRRDPMKIIPTLSYQLAKWHGEYRKDIITLLRGEDEPKLSQSLQWQFELLIKRRLPALNTSKPPKHLIIVIDALDECGDSDSSRSRLAKFIVQLASAAPSVLKVFVTSRLLPELKAVFVQDAALNWHTLNISSGVDKIQVQDDIRHFTKFCADEISLKLTEGEIDILVRKASELFIWTRTVFKFIHSQIDEHEALTSILSPESNRIYNNELDMIYTTVIQSIAQGSNLNLKIVRAVLGAIACTAKNRPLPEDALIHFISNGDWAIRPEALKKAIDCLGAVLYRDTSMNGAIRVCHPSFLDFINEETRSQMFWSDPATLNSTMTTKCFQVLIPGIKFNICDLKLPLLPNDEVPDINVKIYECIPQQLQYSCLYWLEHLLSSGLDVNSDLVQGMLCSLLLNPSAMYWLECLSLLKELKSGMTILMKCSGLYQVSNSSMHWKNTVILISEVVIK